MSRTTLKVILWIAFIVLFFAVFCGVQYFVFHDFDWGMAVFFFIVMTFVDGKGVGYIVDRVMNKE